jgi:hypothetical protein
MRWLVMRLGCRANGDESCLALRPAIGSLWLSLRFRLGEPDAGPAVIFGQEFDTGLFEGAMDCLDRWFRHLRDGSVQNPQS